VSQQNKIVQTHQAHKSSATYVSTPCDGKLVATCGEDRSIKLFDISSGKKLTSLDVHTGTVLAAQFHPSDPILTSASHDRTVCFFDIRTHNEILNQLAIDSASVELIDFASNSLVSVSCDYIKFIDWNPSILFDHFAIGLENIQDQVFL
jgi:WD40 repeat protein